MIDTLFRHIKNGSEYIKKYPQLLMTAVLVVIIPVGFLISGQEFLNAATSNQERLEMDRVGLLHDVFISLILASQVNQEIMQQEIERIASANPDIVDFRIVREEGKDMKIIAALNSSLIQTTDEDPDSYRIANAHPDGSLTIPFAENGVRYWQSYRLVRMPNNADYYIYTKTSLASLDALFASRIMVAYYWLIGILVVVLVLVVRHVRLIDYSYLYRETKKANEMKDLFTNMITHELRAPLTAMRGYASIIREKSVASTDIQSHAMRIEEASSRLVLIVNDLLDVARIQSGKLLVVPEKMDIQKVITGVMESMQSIALEKNIQLARDGVHGEIFIRGDEKRLYQAFTNLVNNSIKYTQSGTITIGVEERSDRVEVRVKDTGMGISAENQKNLFVPFFRVDTTEVNQTIGTGLGMWITKQLIELMRGSIAVESIRGVGTHVVVTLPK